MSRVRRGRPPIEDWRQRSWVEHYNHGDFNREVCWTPKPGDPVGPSMIVPYAEPGSQRKKRVNVRRWLYQSVIVEGRMHDPITWHDVLVARDSCPGLCINPWHQMIVDRRTAGQLMASAYRDRHEAAAHVNAGAVAEAAEEADRKAAEQWFPLFCVERLFGMMVGSKWGLDQLYDKDRIEDRLHEMYDERFGAEHEKMVQWRRKQLDKGRDPIEVHRQQVDTWLRKPGHEFIEDAMDKYDVWRYADELLKRGAWASLLEA